jgi:hypothetical protein
LESLALYECNTSSVSCDSIYENRMLASLYGFYSWTQLVEMFCAEKRSPHCTSSLSHSLVFCHSVPNTRSGCQHCSAQNHSQQPRWHLQGSTSILPKLFQYHSTTHGHWVQYQWRQYSLRSYLDSRSGTGCSRLKFKCRDEYLTTIMTYGI